MALSRLRQVPRSGSSVSNLLVVAHHLGNISAAFLYPVFGALFDALYDSDRTRDKSP